MAISPHRTSLLKYTSLLSTLPPGIPREHHQWIVFANYIDLYAIANILIIFIVAVYLSMWLVALCAFIGIASFILSLILKLRGGTRYRFCSIFVFIVNRTVVTASPRKYRLHHCKRTTPQHSGERHSRFRKDAPQRSCHYAAISRIVPIIRSILPNFSQLAEKKGIVLATHFSDTLPMVLVDEDRFIQIIFNLVGNAVKFTDHGSVTVSAQLFGKQLLIMVTDTGIGILKQDLDAIFDEFAQAATSGNNYRGGTGLGLSITKKLVELQNGTLLVTSTQDAVLPLPLHYRWRIPWRLNSQKCRHDDCTTRFRATPLLSTHR